MTPVDIMIDLETMGIGPNAAIIAIGAVEFNREEATISQEFYEVVDLESSVVAGGIIDPSTILWWMQQGEEARAEFKREGRGICKALTWFSNWMSYYDTSTLRLWGNGSNFDNVILRSAYTRMSLALPWRYYNDRCFRTVRMEHPELDTSGWEAKVAHNALEDAKWQAKYLIELKRRTDESNNIVG